MRGEEDEVAVAVVRPSKEKIFPWMNSSTM